MADTWELTKFVEQHPENKDQRWRLAKKLYNERNYRMALEHLQILQNDWGDKSSVPRYLAATLMRLARFEEGVHVLEEAVKTWPNDAKLLEQLAVLYHACGNQEVAAITWAEVLVLEPEHAFALKASKAISREMRKDPDAPMPEQITSTPHQDAMPCPQCDADNQPEMLTCWSCGSSLDMVSDLAVEDSDDATDARDWFPTLSKIIIVVGLVYIGYRINAVIKFETDPAVLFTFPQTLSEFLFVDLLRTRLVIGISAVVAWPFLIRGAELAAGLEQIDPEESLLQALMFGVTGYALSWVPGIGLSMWIGTMLLLVFGVTGWLYWGQWKLTASLALLQCCFVGILIGTLLTAMHGVGMAKDLFVLESFASRHPSVSSLTAYADTPLNQIYTFESTGSLWADEYLDVAGIRIETPSDALDNNVLLELLKDGVPLLYEKIVGTEMFFYVEEIIPGDEYTVQVSASSRTPITLTFESVLPVQRR